MTYYYKIIVPLFGADYIEQILKLLKSVKLRKVWGRAEQDYQDFCHKINMELTIYK